MAEHEDEIDEESASDASVERPSKKASTSSVEKKKPAKGQIRSKNLEEAKARAKRPADEDEEEEESADSEDEELSEGGVRDDSTKSVARALGVDDGEEAEDDAAEEEQAEPQLNRAQRRREDAIRRRRQREGGAASATSSADDSVEAKETSEPLPKDKNARAKALLKKRQEAATRTVKSLDTAEMVQDSLARASSAAGGFIQRNAAAILTVVGLGAVGGLGYYLWNNHRESVMADTSDQLAQGVFAARGHVDSKEDKRTDEAKKLDPYPMYTSIEARADAALVSFNKVIDQHAGTGGATLAKLGQANAYLDKAQWDQAIDAYNLVASSPLGLADLDVKARATEGSGFAKEGKSDWEGAIASFKTLGTIAGYEDLGKYHEARILLKKGSTDEAKALFLELQKKLEVPSPNVYQSQYVKGATEEYLRAIDPSLAKKQPNHRQMPPLDMEALKNMTPEQKQALMKQLMKQQPGGPGGPPGMPGGPEMPAMPGSDDDQ